MVIGRVCECSNDVNKLDTPGKGASQKRSARNVRRHAPLSHPWSIVKLLGRKGLYHVRNLRQLALLRAKGTLLLGRGAIWNALHRAFSNGSLAGLVSETRSNRSALERPAKEHRRNLHPQSRFDVYESQSTGRPR
jgi:hypothetical protein